MAIKIRGNVVADLSDAVSAPTYGNAVDITTIGNGTTEAVELPRLIKKGSNWDLSQATYTGNTLSVLSQGGTPSDLVFKPDGKVLFTMGESGDSVSVWDLTVDWDITTAVFRERLWIGATASIPRGMYFRPDGHKLYIYDNNYRAVREYNMDIAWNISTASWVETISNTQQRYYIGWQESAANGVYIKPDGTKMWHTGDSDVIDEYELADPYNVSSANFIVSHSIKTIAPSTGNVTFNLTSDINFKPDGTKLYMTNYMPDGVHEFTLSTPWDITTATYNREFVPVGNGDEFCEGIEWNGDGTRFFLFGYHQDIVTEYSVTTAWQLTGVTLQHKYSIADILPAITSMRFSDDGNKAYMLGNSQDAIWVLNLTSPYSLDRPVVNSIIKFGFQSGGPRGIHVNNEGTQVYVVGSSGDECIQYTLSTPHDFKTTSGDLLEMFLTGNEYTGLFFKPDGTRMYIINSTGATVEEWALSTPWKIGTGTLVQQMGTISQREPRGLWFRGDGNRLFITGETGDYVDSYYLSTSWDISTMVHEQRVAVPDSYPRGLAFKTDGSKMWVIGTSGDKVYEYDMTSSRIVFESNVDIASDAEVGGNLTVGKELIAQGRIDSGDVRTDYIKVEKNLRFGLDGVINPAMDTDLAISQRIGEIGQFDINEYDSKVNDVWVSPDGTKLYALGGTGYDIYQFDLTTPYDVNTRSYVRTKDLRSVCGAREPKGVWFNPDGTQCWIIDYLAFVVFKLTLSTAWDISTLSFSGNTPTSTYDISPYLSAPGGIFWKSDGLKYWIVGDSTNSIKQFTCSSAWNISTSSYQGQLDTDTFTASDGISLPTLTGLDFKPDGTKVFLADQYGGIFAFNLSTAWDITTASFNPKTIKKSGAVLGAGSCDDIWVNNAGTIALLIDSNRIRKLTMSTAHDASTAVYSQEVTVDQPGAAGISASEDGTKIFVIDSTFDAITRYDLTTGFDLTTLYHQGGSTTSLDVSSRLSTMQGLTMDPTGTKMYLCGSTTADIVQYSLSTAHTPSSGTYVRTLDLSGLSSTLRDVAIGDNGTKMYVVTDLAIYTYTLSTAYDISTATLTATTTLSDFDPYGRLSMGSMRDCKFKPDGTKLYVVDTTTDRVLQYDLKTAWDITGSSLKFITDSRTLIDGTTEGVTFDSSGVYMYIAGNSTNQVAQYRLREPWMLSSAEYQKRRKVGEVLTSPTCIYISPDGLKLSIGGSVSGNIYTWTLGTPFELAHMDTGQIYYHEEIETSPTGVHITANGEHMYFVGTATDRANHYVLETPWDLTTVRFETYNTGFTNDAYMYECYVDPNGENWVYYDYSYRYFRRYTLPTNYYVEGGTGQTYISGGSIGSSILGFHFSNNGYTMWIVDSTPDKITSVTLTTPYDPSTMDGGEWKFVGNYEAVLEGITFKSDGTKMYTVGSSGDEANQFALSTAWDITTAVYEKNFRINGFESVPTSFQFKSDGTKMYFLGETSRSIYEYSLSTAWDIGTSTYIGRRFIGDLSPSPQGMFIRSDNGGKIYLVGNYDDNVVEYDQATGWAIASTGGIPANDVLDTKDQDVLPTGVFLKPDGTKLWTCGDASEDVWEYDMSTAFNIKTATYNSVKYVPNFGATRTHDIYFNDTGDVMYVLSQYRNCLAQYTLSAPWNISAPTLQYVFNLTFATMFYYSSSTSFDGMTGIAFSNDGKILYLTNSYNNTVSALEVPVAWDLRSCSPKSRSYYVDVAEGQSMESNVGDIYLCSDGTKMFSVGRDANSVREYALSTPFDISTSTYTQQFAISDGDSYGLHFSPDGFNMYTTGYATDYIRWYTLSTSFDVSTATQAGTLLVDENSQPFGDQIPISIHVRYDGKKMYMLGQYNTKIVEWDLTTPWDVTTAVYKQYRSVADACHYPYGMAWKQDGTRLYFVDDDRDSFVEMICRTPWDISTLEPYRRKSFPYGFLNPGGITFSADGDYVYFSSRFMECVVQLPITNNYLSIEGRVALNGSTTHGGNVTNTRDVYNYGRTGFGTGSPRSTIDAGNKTDGIILPTGTTTERPGGAVEGTIRYNTTLGQVECYKGGSWHSISNMP